MNDGLGAAAGSGIPIVSSSVGSAGYPFRDGEEFFMADSPEEFGEKCNHCLRDPITWHNFRLKSQLIIAEYFSPWAVSGKLGEIFKRR